MAENQDNNNQQDSNITPNQGVAYIGLNLSSILRQVKPGQLTFALNAQVENFDGNSITYMNEQGNEQCCKFPVGYKLVGSHSIYERNKDIFFLANPITGDSEIGYQVNGDCVYHTLVNQKCLNFDINFPIHKIVHKITSCGTEIYWPNKDGRKFLDIDNLPYATQPNGNTADPCDVITLSTIDCNKLNVQPNFKIPTIDYKEVSSEGNTQAGTYQFAFQYTNSLGDPYTAYYTITNPISINDPFKVTPDFNYFTGKSIKLTISDIDTTGIYDYFNVAVLKTINNITSVDLVGTYKIERDTQDVLYTGTSKENITLTINDIFQKYPFYSKANDIMVSQDVLMWVGLTTEDRVSLQEIANNVRLQWQTWRIASKQEGYKNSLNTANVKGYMRDEVYPFDLVVEYTNGYQTDRFPIPGRLSKPTDLQMIANGDSNLNEQICEDPQPEPRWRVYNTATKLGTSPEFIGNESNDCYEGPYEFGEFAYWESTETYPCNEAVYGSLAGQPIRHHKFPDNTISNHYDQGGNIYPMGVRIDLQTLYDAITTSTLSPELKGKIARIKIVRGDRTANKSIDAKGLIYNVGKYSKNNADYYYPNYPYNDLRKDPFIKINLDEQLGTVLFSKYEEVENVDGLFTTFFEQNIDANTFVNTNDRVRIQYTGEFTSSGTQREFSVGVAGHAVFVTLVTPADALSWIMKVIITKSATSGRLKVQSTLTIPGYTQSFPGLPMTHIYYIDGVDMTAPINTKLVVKDISTRSGDAESGNILGESLEIRFTPGSTQNTLNPELEGFSTPASQERYTFHSPDTSFYQPFLGNILKLETIESGLAKVHFVEVKNHAKYKFPTLSSYLLSVGVGVIIGFASATIGVSTEVFNGTAAFTAFAAFNDIIFKLIPRKNFAYQYNSVGNYTKSTPIPNDTGDKQRRLEIAQYIISGLQAVGDDAPVNNYQRESSVYLKTATTLPYPDANPDVPQDTSRITGSQAGCGSDFIFRPISAYYASIRRVAPDQYGQIGSYQPIDTGFIFYFTPNVRPTTQFASIFGGDTFINKFSFKRKFPFFVDNRVSPINTPPIDDSDIFYDELGNVGYPTYWFSTDIQQGDGGKFGLGQLFGVKVHNFDCKGTNFFYASGKIYLFAYGIPTFYVESAVNVDYRQATNDLAGDFYPRVGGDIPDEWLQEYKVSILNDNTYTYNKSFSKQNDENVYTTLPIDFVPNQQCSQFFPNKLVYSDQQQDQVNFKKNNWLIYRPVSYFDFPLSNGKVVSVQGLENKEVLVIYENKSLVYNALLTLNTSQPLAAYLGNEQLFKGAPPMSFKESDAGYAGAQNKFFAKTEFGHVLVDAKRGQVFLIGPREIYGGRQLKDITGGEFNVNQFFTENLDFKIIKKFPNYPTDNHFNGVGLHGVFDARYNRLILTKLDYEVTSSSLTWDSQSNTFHDGDTTIALGDPRYFCNKSFTISFDFDNNAWVSFHSYLPNYYLTGVNIFYTGMNSTETGVWRHNTSLKSNTFYGQQAPYIIEYPFAFKYQDELLQNVKDYTRVLNYTDDIKSFTQVDDVYFNKAWLYNSQQHSGLLELIMKKKNDLSAYMGYPKYNGTSKTIQVTKSNSFYNYNTFWDVVKDKTKPFLSRSCESLSLDKILIESNLDYGKRSFKKAPLMAKDLKIRHILDNQTDYRFISQFIVAPSQISYK